jgi:hypothetical protein
MSKRTLNCLSMSIFNTYKFGFWNMHEISLMICWEPRILRRILLIKLHHLPLSFLHKWIIFVKLKIILLHGMSFIDKTLNLLHVHTKLYRLDSIAQLSKWITLYLGSKRNCNGHNHIRGGVTNYIAALLVECINLVVQLGYDWLCTSPVDQQWDN